MNVSNTPATTVPGAKVDDAESLELCKVSLSPFKVGKGVERSVLFEEEVEYEGKNGDPLEGFEKPVLPLRGSSANASGGVFNLMATAQADIYAFMSLIQKMAQTMRKSDQEIRNAAVGAQVAELNNGAKEMEKAAASRLTAAQTQAWFSIGTGAATAVAGGVGAFGAYKSNQAGTARSLAHASKDFDAGRVAKTSEKNWDNFAKSTMTGTDGVGRAAQGWGQLLSASDSKAAENHDAEKLRREAASKVHEQESTDAQARAQQMLDIMRDVQSKLAAMEQSNSETIRQMARN